MNIYDVKTTLFTRAKATELIDYYNQLNNSAGWVYEIVDGNTCQRAYRRTIGFGSYNARNFSLCECYIRITSPEIEQFDGSNIVGYF